MGQQDKTCAGATGIERVRAKFQLRYQLHVEWPDGILPPELQNRPDWPPQRVFQLQHEGRPACAGLDHGDESPPRHECG